MKQPKDYTEDDHCKPIGKWDRVLLGAGLFAFGGIIGASIMAFIIE